MRRTIEWDLVSMSVSRITRHALLALRTLCKLVYERTQFFSRLDLRWALKQLFRSISQIHLLATQIGNHVFIDATMSMGLRNTCKLFVADFMKTFIRGLAHHYPELFSDGIGISMIFSFWQNRLEKANCSY